LAIALVFHIQRGPCYIPGRRFVCHYWFIIIALLIPRVTILLLYFFTNWFQGLFSNVLFPILGFIFLPLRCSGIPRVQNWFQASGESFPFADRHRTHHRHFSGAQTSRGRTGRVKCGVNAARYAQASTISDPSAGPQRYSGTIKSELVRRMNSERCAKRSGPASIAIHDEAIL